MKEALITAGVVTYLVIGIIFWALFSAAHDADKQEPVYDEDGKKHSGLLTEED